MLLHFQNTELLNFSLFARKHQPFSFVNVLRLISAVCLAKYYS